MLTNLSVELRPGLFSFSAEDSRESHIYKNMRETSVIQDVTLVEESRLGYQFKAKEISQNDNDTLSVEVAFLS